MTPRRRAPRRPGAGATEPMPKARITIRLKPTVLDAQGAVVRNALHSLGFESVEDVHVGKYIELDLASGADEQLVEEMCRKLLANPIIEQYSIALTNEG
jgi:phosphoribosylformylglycinamidine synthase PurS subunit